MLRPFSFLWKQLNGPQVTAFVQGIWDYIHTQLNDKLRYFNSLSIDTAYSGHLSTIGITSNLPRPMINDYDSSLFWFTTNKENPTEHGFADMNNLKVGGKFTELDDQLNTRSIKLVPTEYYRVILQAARDTDAQPGSLAFMDAIIDRLRKKDNPEQQNVVYYNFITEIPEGLVNRLYGDVEIYIGKESRWNDTATVVACVQAIANSVNNPTPNTVIELADYTPPTTE